MDEGARHISADYGTKVRFSRGEWIDFPDFSLTSLGTGTYTGGGRHVPMTYYYFRLVRGNKDTIIFWSSGTGLITPVPFEFNNEDFLIEMRLMTYGREGEDQSFSGKNRLRRMN